MLVFEPVEIKEKVLNAIKAFEFIDGDIEDVPFSDIIDETKHQQYDVEITDSSIVCVAIGISDYPQIPLSYFLYIFDQWKSSKLNSTQSYVKSQNEVDYLLSIGINHYATVELLQALEECENPIVHKSECGTEFWSTCLEINKKEYRIALFRGLCLYHFKVQESDNFDKYFPSYNEDDYFVRITCNSDIDISIADQLAISLVFEVQATHQLVLEFSNGRYDPQSEYYNPYDEAEKNYNIFPLTYGKGIKEVLEIYNKAKSTSDIDYKILNFTKVIEYISPTMANEALYRDVQLKLTSPKVLSPTSEFVDELGKIYKKHQNDISKDGELIRLAISTVVDVCDIWDVLPDFIKAKKGKQPDALNEELKQDYLEKIILSVYDTRNQIAHAKANYEKKGNECPEKEKLQFSQLVDAIAVRCIRWFSMQPENIRAVSLL